MAERLLPPTEVLADMHDQRVELVEPTAVTRGMSLKHPSNVFVLGVSTDPTVATEQSLRVGVYDEDRVLARVQENRIGGFRPYTEDREKLLPQLDRGGREHAADRSLVLAVEKLAEGFELSRLLSEITGGANQSLEPWQGGALDSPRRQQTRRTELSEGKLDVFPGRVLGQNGADDDFKRSLPGPPVLGAE